MHRLLDIIQNEVHQLVIALEDTGDWGTRISKTILYRPFLEAEN